MAQDNTSRPKRRALLSRRNLLVAGGAATLGGAAVFGAERALFRPDDRMSAPDDLLWGVCGHPFTAYPGISFESQLDMVKRLGFSHYRVDFRTDNPEAVDTFLRQARERKITILPIIQSPVDIKVTSADELYRRSYDAGRRVAKRYRRQIRIWEIGNEEEVFAIIKGCEMRDNGKQYPCEWGPAGGVDAQDYYGPRWKKVSAVLAGLSRGVKAGDPNALIAMGTAGWGHLGAFDRFVQDGLQWDITVWHDYPKVPTDFLAKLADFKKPIWITEFNSGSGGDHPLDVNAEMLTERIKYYRAVRKQYDVAAAFVYELFDEDYWGDTFEARQGLVSITETSKGSWAAGAVKPPGEAVRKAISR